MKYYSFVQKFIKKHNIKIKMVMKLKGKVALVTGASSGIGFGIAQSLSNHGCKVIMNSNRN